MPEKTDNKDFVIKDKRKVDTESEKEKKDSWSEDQNNRRYYYDDASNYQVYLPEDEDEDKPDK